jgi:hypothetical protein
VTESTAFSLQDEQVVPVQYKYRRSGLGKNRNTVLTFDWDNMKVLNDVQSDPWEMDIKEGTTDKLLYQMKMQQDLVSAHSKGQPWPVLEYQVADSGRLKRYHFEVIDEEVIDTPVGKINTIKVSRINDRKNRTTTFWLALDYGFILVRFRQKTDKGKGFELLLKEAEFDGKQI